MKFKVSTSGSSYTEDEANRLKELGFTFEPRTYPIDKFGPQRTHHMTGDDVEIDIASLEDLIAFSGKWGEIIVSGEFIEIYDSHRE